jgi:thiamine biosynthesis lipoprotein
MANHFEHVELCMGTAFRCAGNSPLNPDETQAVLSQAVAKLHEADQIFSLYKPESPLSQLARGETSVAKCPPVVDEVWNLCEKWEKTTDGWFSPFTPAHTFDPSGLVKTWAAQASIDVLLGAGLTDFTMNAGGDVFIGPALTDPIEKKLGIHKPVSIAAQDAGVLTVIDLAGTDFNSLATSGSAERGAHIWNPRNPDREPSELLQVSVVADDLVKADVWATAAFAAGMQGVALLNAVPNLEALFVLASGDLAATDGFIKLFAKA